MEQQRNFISSRYHENFAEIEENGIDMRVSTPQSPEIAMTHSFASETSASLESSSSNDVKPCRNGKCKLQKRKAKKASNTLLFPTTSSMPAYYQYLLLHSLQMEEDVDVVLPRDPRLWSINDVNLWLMELSLEQNINPPLDSSKFPFNGKALCTLKVDMFVSRVPDFGKMLYKDVQLRLAKALLTEKVAADK